LLITGADEDSNKSHLVLAKFVYWCKTGDLPAGNEKKKKIIANEFSGGNLLTATT